MIPPLWLLVTLQKRKGVDEMQDDPKNQADTDMMEDMDDEATGDQPKWKGGESSGEESEEENKTDEDENM